MLHYPRQGRLGFSPPCYTPSLCVGPQDLRTQPSARRGLLHSRKEMEVIHLGYCDCPFPGRGCAWEVRAAFPGRPHPPSSPRLTARPFRLGSEAGAAAEGGGAVCWRGQPPTCCGHRESRRSRAPRPHALLQTDFLFAAARPGLLPGPGNRRRPRVSRGLPRLLGPASHTPESRPRPASPLAPVARHQRALCGRRGGA